MSPADKKKKAVRAQEAQEARHINIASKDHEKLLNIIDDLRSQGISRYIDLPQVIVCGDQSSGKSSVLEAVSGLKFPTKDALCTRFATELILRRHTEVTSSVSIVPDISRPDAEKIRLQEFKSTDDVHNALGEIVAAAAQAMGLDGTTKNFCSDVLRIELSGPKQPHLTLVDLPGVFHSGSKSQSAADAAAVKSLVEMYMAKSRSIILAVVSAKNDFNNQIVTKLAKDHDPEGSRTLGIITKPDTLPPGSDSEKQYFELAANKDVNFRLGWHVLKNRDYDQRDCTNAERDESEKAFFASGIWTSLLPTQLGVDHLRPRLSRVLQGQILNELPSLIKDVEAGLKDCGSRLELLGSSRGTLEEQRLHLHAVSDAFTSIIKEAVRGKYDDDYFGGALEDQGYVKRIRAIASNMLDDFAKDVRLKGHKWEIVSIVPTVKSTAPPLKVRKTERLEKIAELIKRNRGAELATIAKEDTITTLFKDQCSPWIKLAKLYAKKMFDIVKKSMLFALKSTCDETTLVGILRHIVNPAFDKIKDALDRAVNKVLQQHVQGRPLTYNHYLTDNLQKLRNKHDSEHMANRIGDFFGYYPNGENHTTQPMTVNTKALLTALTPELSEADMMLQQCSESLYIMESYYKVALKNFVDDFAIYAIEHELLNKLENIFCPAQVIVLKDNVIEDIAGETEESQIERISTTAKLETLKQALKVLKSLDPGHLKCKSPIEILPQLNANLDRNECPLTILCFGGSFDHSYVWGTGFGRID